MTKEQSSGTGMGAYSGTEDGDYKRSLYKRSLLNRLIIPITCVLAVFLTMITFAAVGIFASKEGWCYQLFFERSWIQYANTLFFWLAVISLLIRRLRHQHEVKACDAIAVELEKSEYYDMSWQNAFILEERLHEADFKKHYRSLVFTRVTRALRRLMKTKSTGEMREYMRIRSEIDSEELESSYAGVRYLTWLIPTLGFVGTVLGISAGISSCGGIVQQTVTGGGEMPDISFALQALGTAFDTTFLALVYSAIVVFFTSCQSKQEEQTLERIDHLCIDDVCGKFEDHSTVNDSLIERLGRLEDLIIRNIHGDAGSLRETITQIPGQIAKAISSALDEIQQQYASTLKEVCETVKNVGLDSSQVITHRLDGIENTLADSLDKGNLNILKALHEIGEQLQAGFSEMKQDNKPNPKQRAKAGKKSADKNTKNADDKTGNDKPDAKPAHNKDNPNDGGNTPPDDDSTSDGDIPEDELPTKTFRP